MRERATGRQTLAARPQCLGSGECPRQGAQRLGPLVAGCHELHDRRVDLRLPAVERQGDPVVPVDDPVPAVVLHHFDRRQDRQGILGPVQPLPARLPVAPAERLEREEVAAALIAASDGRPGDLIDRDRPQADLDRAGLAHIGIGLVEVGQWVRGATADAADTHTGSLRDRPLDSFHRIADPADERLSGSRDGRDGITSRPCDPANASRRSGVGRRLRLTVDVVGHRDESAAWRITRPSWRYGPGCNVGAQLAPSPDLTHAWGSRVDAWVCPLTCGADPRRPT